MQSDTSVVIGVASGGSWHSRFGACLVRMVSWSSQMTPKNTDQITTYLSTVDSSMLSANMLLYADYAMKVGATHLLTLEVDMVFPQDVLNRLLEHDVDIVGANYTYKSLPPKPITRGFDDEIIHSRGRQGCERVASIGFGITLIKTEIFKKMDRPYFKEVWLEKEQVVASGDTYFCQKVRDCGFDIWVDHDLSADVMHLGTFAFSEYAADNLGDPNALADAH